MYIIYYILSVYIITHCSHKHISAYFNVNETDSNKYNNLNNIQLSITCVLTIEFES